MLIYVDIDNTICTTIDSDYKNSKPIQENIDKINRLYNEGNTIVYWTARGRVTRKNWSILTRKQLRDWGCLHHKLDMSSKPAYDRIIDDKAFKINEL
jgi:hypothetical protein